MRDEFNSKLYLESEKGSVVGRFVLMLFLLVIGICLAIKLLVRDFSGLGIPAVSVILLLSYWVRKNTRVRYVYAHGQCVIDYGREEMTITYPNMNAGNRGFFKDINVIRYENIEDIQFGKELGCFRIIAMGNRTREYNNNGEIKTIQMTSVDKTSETYIYVLEEEAQERVLRNLQKKVGFFATILENNEHR